MQRHLVVLSCASCGTQRLHSVTYLGSVFASATCTVCGGRLRKVFSPVGIVFKGSGFYRTDSRGKPAKADGDGDKAKKAADATSSSKGSTSEGGGGSTSKPKAAEKSA